MESRDIAHLLEALEKLIASELFLCTARNGKLQELHYITCNLFLEITMIFNLKNYMKFL